MPLHYWILISLATLAVLSALALWSWGHYARRARGEPSQAIAPPALGQAPDDVLREAPEESPLAPTELDRCVAPLLQAHPGLSGAELVCDNVDAFVVRAQTARAAGRSLDVQYYIWHNDRTGKLLKNEIMAAAERGVRVRMLVDDMNAVDRDHSLRRMDLHPNLEVRLFNPARNRPSSVARSIEMVLRFIGFNRRMHNKAWIADGRVAIVGGRNIGDEYFDAAEHVNFSDTDLLLVGPAVAQASAIFDEFWNSDAVIPLAALRGRRSHRDAARSPERAQAQRDQLRTQRDRWVRAADHTPWLDSLARHGTIEQRLTRPDALAWSDSLRVVSDPPEKAAPLRRTQSRARWLLYDVMALLYSAREETTLISPYFVPGTAGSVTLAGQAARNIRVRVLTNSLAATDVPIVHAGYTRYREPLLRAGVELWELKASGRPRRHLFDATRAMAQRLRGERGARGRKRAGSAASASVPGKAAPAVRDCAATDSPAHTPASPPSPAATPDSPEAQPRRNDTGSAVGGSDGRSLVGGSGASLHTKSFIIDGTRGFVGSFNFDPRSAQLNTEMGVLFDDERLGRALLKNFDRSIEPDDAYRVLRESDGTLRWKDWSDRGDVDPDTTRRVRLLVWLLRWLPVESQL